ncbi:hypothetical protein QE152_g24677 [Popillia japonica]|uniref:Uncharacterized protein n=1 Tax=Popillia japonica TaxID=7064 RepID=A0AAW1K6M7_POPJA
MRSLDIGKTFPLIFSCIDFFRPPVIVRSPEKPWVFSCIDFFRPPVIVRSPEKPWVLLLRQNRNPKPYQRIINDLRRNLPNHQGFPGAQTTPPTHDRSSSKANDPEDAKVEKLMDVLQSLFVHIESDTNVIKEMFPRKTNNRNGAH